MIEASWNAASWLPTEELGQSRLPAAELPEVVAAENEGCWLAPESPMWVFLPTVWPEWERRWLPDRSTHYLTEWCTGQEPRTLAWSPDVAAEIEHDLNEILVQCGLPPRPPGRLWLLRLPPGFPTLEAVLTELIARADAEGAPLMACPTFVGLSAASLTKLFRTPYGTSRSSTRPASSTRTPSLWA